MASWTSTVTIEALHPQLLPTFVTDKGEVDFDRMVPIPEELREGDPCDFASTNWGSHIRTRPCELDEQGTSLTYTMQGCQPDILLEKLCQRYPEEPLLFVDENDEYGTTVYINCGGVLEIVGSLGFDDEEGCYDEETLDGEEMFDRYYGAPELYAQERQMQYAYTDGGAILQKCCLELDSEDLPIPDEHKGHPLVKIGREAGSGYYRIRQLDLPEGLLTLGHRAFRGCVHLEKLVLPDSLKEIEGEAFAHCWRLERVVLPPQLAYIGKGAFAGCRALAELVFDGTEEAWLRIKKEEGWDATGTAYTLSFTGRSGEVIPVAGSKGLSYEEVEGGYAVSDIGRCRAEHIKIPAYHKGLPVVKILRSAFHGASLVSVEIPEGVREIGEHAFARCYRLEKIELPTTLEVIGERAFRHCELLNTVVLRKTPREIGEAIFTGCPRLSLLRFDNGLYWGPPENPYLMLVKKAYLTLTECDVHPDTKYIHPYAFFKCGRLTRVGIPEGVLTIGYGAFFECDSLEELSLPASLQRLEHIVEWYIRITYNGSKAEWESLPKLDTWDSNIEAYTILLTDGEVTKGGGYDPEEGEDEELASCEEPCAVLVEFEGLGNPYTYNCELPISVGDRVRVGGRLADRIGTVVEIWGEWDDRPFMQQVTEILDGDD